MLVCPTKTLVCPAGSGAGAARAGAAKASTSRVASSVLGTCFWNVWRSRTLRTVDLGDQTSFQVLRRGTDVISSDGVVIGAVKQVRWDGRTNIFDGIVVDPKAGGGRRFVDAPEVQAIHERGVLIAHASTEIAS